MEALGNGWTAEPEQDSEQGLLICGIYCNIYELKTICLSKEIFKKAAF